MYQEYFCPKHNYGLFFQHAGLQQKLKNCAFAFKTLVYGSKQFQIAVVMVSVCMLLMAIPQTPVTGKTSAVAVSTPSHGSASEGTPASGKKSKPVSQITRCSSAVKRPPPFQEIKIIIIEKITTAFQILQIALKEIQGLE